MLVETYEITELTENGVVENPEETKALIESLGLTEQEKFFNGEKQSVFPYRKMTAKEGLVYRTICSKSSKLEKYGDGLIPLRVLQVAAHAKAFESSTGTLFIDELEVLHCPTADIKDPVLVGKHNTKNSWGGTDTEFYLLARWGEALESFSELSKIALKMLKDKVKAELAHGIAELKTLEASLDATVESKFNNGEAVSVSVYTR